MFVYLVNFKDDAPPRYSDVSIRHSRARVDYGVSSSRSHYADPYGDRSVKT